MQSSSRSKAWSSRASVLKKPRSIKSVSAFVFLCSGGFDALICDRADMLGVIVSMWQKRLEHEEKASCAQSWAPKLPPSFLHTNASCSEGAAV